MARLSKAWKDLWSHRSFLIVMIGTTLISLSLWVAGGMFHYNWLMTDLKDWAKDKSDTLLYSVSITLNRRFTLLEGHALRLLEFKTTKNRKAEIGRVGKILRIVSPDTRCFSFRPLGEQSLSFPRDNSKSCRSFLDSKSIEDMQLLKSAFNSRIAVLTGPYLKKSGEKHLTAILAVHKGSFYVGLVSFTFDLESLLKEAGWKKLRPSGMRIALRKASGNPLYGDNEIFGLDPVIRKVQIRGGDWEIAIIPEAGWWKEIKNQVIILGAITFLLAISSIVTAFLMIDRRFPTIIVAAEGDDSHPVRRKNDNLDRERESSDESDPASEEISTGSWLSKLNPFTRGRHASQQNPATKGASQASEKNAKEIKNLSGQVKSMDEKLDHLVTLIESRMKKSPPPGAQQVKNAKPAESKKIEAGSTPKVSESNQETKEAGINKAT